MASFTSSIKTAFGAKWPNNDFTIRLAQHLGDDVKVKTELPLAPGDVISQVRSESQSRQNAVDELWEQLETAMIHAIYGSNMIEFAGTSLDITSSLCRAVFRGQETSSDIDERDPEYAAHRQALIDTQRDADKDAIIQSRREVINHAKAWSYMVERVILNNEALSEDAIRETHRILYTGLQDEDVVPSEYRTYRVAVGYGAGRPAQCMAPNGVPGRMAQMAADLADEIAAARMSGVLDPYTLAARYHHVFVSIHPFGDGNGRVSRIILNVLLLKHAGHVCTIGMAQEQREDYLQEVKQGARAFRKEDGEVEYGRQQGHFGLAKHVLGHSIDSLRGMARWVEERSRARE